MKVHLERALNLSAAVVSVATVLGRPWSSIVRCHQPGPGPIGRPPALKEPDRTLRGTAPGLSFRPSSNDPSRRAHKLLFAGALPTATSSNVGHLDGYGFLLGSSFALQRRTRRASRDKSSLVRLTLRRTLATTCRDGKVLRFPVIYAQCEGD
jgi:hypothetical protein